MLAVKSRKNTRKNKNYLFFFFFIYLLVMPKYWGKLFRRREIPEVRQKQKTEKNTTGTVGGLGGHDRTMAIKSRKNARKSFFFLVKK